ncbi:unnamed protein product [Vitrella brassicaformis CCMP3155]|uniref:Sushi domain-containing protein n=2 Tax=Vitrella brassicaformis TaxID=1169539 RepID=A0A0G4G7G2_VITBC|nr:unnamed protein product [Vitrella brassicaformis CCMP3155]|eukprot:CEM24571.1 unnamed protein product [Vitrella brassicaformis CCMP3155]
MPSRHRCCPAAIVLTALLPLATRPSPAPSLLSENQRFETATQTEWLSLAGGPEEDALRETIGDARWRETEGVIAKGELLPVCLVHRAEVISLKVTAQDKRLPWRWEDAALGTEGVIFDGEDHPPHLHQIDKPPSGGTTWLGFAPGRYVITAPNGLKRVCFRWAESQSEGFTFTLLLAFDRAPSPEQPVVFLDNFWGFRLGAVAAFDEDGDWDPDHLYIGLLDPIHNGTAPEKPRQGGKEAAGGEGRPPGMAKICWRSERGFVFHFVVSQSTMQIFMMGNIKVQVRLPDLIVTNLMLPSPLTLGCDHRGQRCLRGRIRYFHYANIGRLQNNIKGAVQQISELLNFDQRCGDGEVQAENEECDVEKTPDDCSCDCRKMCPPYIKELQRLQQPVDAYLAKFGDRGINVFSPKYLRRSGHYGSVLTLRCQTVGNTTYHGFIEEDTIKCGAIQSGACPPKILECLKDCVPSDTPWWPQTDLGAAQAPRYKVLSPLRASRICHGELIEVTCALPFLPPLHVEDAVTSLFCSDGLIDELDLPCKQPCPSTLLQPPDYVQPLSDKRYRVDGGDTGFAEGAERTVSCQPGYLPPVNAALQSTLQKVQCTDGAWSPVVLECHGQCPPFRFRGLNPHIYVLDPPTATIRLLPPGSTVSISCGAGSVPREGQEASETVGCTFYGKDTDCDDPRNWKWTDYQLDCKTPCGPHPYVGNGTAELMFDVEYVGMEGTRVENITTVPYGTAVRLSCDSRNGYAEPERVGGAEASDIVKCEGGDLGGVDEYSRSDLQCFKQCMGYPELYQGRGQTNAYQVIYNGRSSPPFRHGSTAEISCTQVPDITMMESVIDRQTLTCLEGVWTPNRLHCRAPCGPWFPLPEGRFRTEPPQREIAQARSFAHGFKLRVMCQRDPAVSAVKDREMPNEEETVTCADGQWGRVSIHCQLPCLPVKLLGPSSAYVGGELHRNYWPPDGPPEPPSAIDLYDIDNEAALRGTSAHGTRVTIRCAAMKPYHPYMGPDEEALVCSQGDFSKQHVICGPDCPAFPSFHPFDAYIFPRAARRASTLDPRQFFSARKAPAPEQIIEITDPLEVSRMRSDVWQPHGTELTVRCNTERTFVPDAGKADRAQTLVCDRGRITGALLKCMAPCQPYPAQKLEFPDLYEASLTSGQETTEAWLPHGTKLNIKCSTLSGASATPRQPGQAEAVCINGTWSPFPPPFQCNKKCSAPGMDAAYEVLGQRAGGEYQHGDVLYVRCANERSFFNGTARPGAQASIACLRGEWGPPMPFLSCKRSCRDLADLIDPFKYSFRVADSANDLSNTTACEGPACAAREGPDVEAPAWRTVSCGRPGERDGWKKGFGSDDCTTLRCMDGLWTPRDFECKADSPPPLKKRYIAGVEYVKAASAIKDAYKHGDIEYVECRGSRDPYRGFAAMPPHEPDYQQPLSCHNGRFEPITIQCRPYAFSHLPTFEASTLTYDSDGIAYLSKPQESMRSSHLTRDRYFRHNSWRWIRCADGWSDPTWQETQPDNVVCYNGTWGRQAIRCKRNCPGADFLQLSPLYNVSFSGNYHELVNAVGEKKLLDQAFNFLKLYPPRPLNEPLDRSIGYREGDFMAVNCTEGYDLTSPMTRLKERREVAGVPIEVEDCSGHACDVLCLDGKWTELQHFCHPRCPPFKMPQPQRMLCDPPEFCKRPGSLTDEDKSNPFFSPSDAMWMHGSAFVLKCDPVFCPHPPPENETINCDDGEWTRPTLACPRNCLSWMDMTIYRPDEEAERYVVRDAPDNPPLAENRTDPDTGRVLPLYLHGSRQLVSCNTTRGFESTLSRPIEDTECQDGVWTLTGIQCRRDCPPLPVYFEHLGDSITNYAIDGGESLRHSTVVVVFCAKMYSAVSGSEGETIECNDGSWWPLQLRCRKMCIDYVEWATANDVAVTNQSRYEIVRPRYHLTESLFPSGRSLEIRCAIRHSDAMSLTEAGANRQTVRCLDGEYTSRLLICEANCPEYVPEDDYALDARFGTSMIVQGRGTSMDTAHNTGTARNGATRTVSCCTKGAFLYPGEAEASAAERPTCRWTFATNVLDPPYRSEVHCSNGHWSEPEMQCHPMCEPFGYEMVYADGRKQNYYHPEKGYPIPPMHGLIVPGAATEVRCADGYLPEPQQDTWDARPAFKTICFNGYLTSPFSCMKMCPVPFRESHKMVRYNVAGPLSVEFENLAYDDFVKQRPWVRRHRGRYYAFCYTPHCQGWTPLSKVNQTVAAQWNVAGSIGGQTEPKTLYHGQDWMTDAPGKRITVRGGASGCLQRRRTIETGLGRKTIWGIRPPAAVNIFVKVWRIFRIGPPSSVHVYYLKWFWQQQMANPVARLHGERSGKHYQCLYGSWVGQPDEALTCVQSFSQKTCIDPNASLWRLPPSRDPPSAPWDSFSFGKWFLPPMMHWMSSWQLTAAAGLLLAALVGSSDRVDFRKLESVPAQEVVVGDRVLSFSKTRGVELTDVYFRESYAASDTTEVVDLVAEPLHHHNRTSCAPAPPLHLTLSPSHRLPIVAGERLPTICLDPLTTAGDCAESALSRQRHVSAAEVRQGDWLVRVEGPQRPQSSCGDISAEGDGLSAAVSLARVTRAHQREEPVPLELIYTGNSHFVANQVLVADGDEPMDAYLPYTLLSNLDTRIVYWLFGAAGVDGAVFRRYWRWTVQWSDFVQSALGRLLDL